MRAIVSAEGVGSVELLVAQAARVCAGLEVQAENVLTLHRLRLEGGATVLAQERAL